MQRRGRLSPRRRRRPARVVELRARSRAGFERNAHLLPLPMAQASNVSEDARVRASLDSQPFGIHGVRHPGRISSRRADL